MYNEFNVSMSHEYDIDTRAMPFAQIVRHTHF